AAIVNERFVQLYLPEGDPLGRRIHVGKSEVPLTIVGVATTVRQQVAGGMPDPVVFLPLRAAAPLTAALIVRAAGDPAVPIAQLRRDVAAIDPHLPLYRAITFDQALRDAYWNTRQSVTIVRSIATVALLLAL